MNHTIKLTKLQAAVEATHSAQESILAHYGKTDPEDLFDWPEIQNALYALETIEDRLASAAYRESLDTNIPS